MKNSIAFLALVPVFILSINACKNSSAGAVKPFCDTSCLSDTMKFNLDHPQQPYVYITAKGCLPDSLIWSHSSLENNRKMGLADLLERSVHLNKTAVDCFIKDTSYAWLKFNDCKTGRGYLLKLPFNKKYSISNYSSALNNFDTAYKVAGGLICYADYAFLYAEDMINGKVEKLLLNDHEVKIDFNNIHKTFESVNITRTKMEANIIIDGNKKHLEKVIKL